MRFPTMRFGSVVGALVILGASAMPAATLSAQEPAGFDGQYLGSATLTHGGGGCSVIRSVDMTVTGAQVVVREIHLNGGAYTYRGSVSGVGEVSAVYQSKALPTDVGPSAFTVSGTIHEKAFTGQRRHGVGKSACFFNIELIKG